MREFQVYPPKKRKPYDVVRQLRFIPSSDELLALVGSEERTVHGRTGFTTEFHVYNLATGVARELYAGYGYIDGVRGDPLVSPDCRLFVHESQPDYDVGGVEFTAILGPDSESGSYPQYLPSCPHGMGGLAFTADGKELLGVRNLYEGIHPQGGRWVPEVVRFAIAELDKPPVRFEEKINPLNGKTYRARVYDVGWCSVMLLPGDKIATVGLSTDGRLLAVGGVMGAVHVADLIRKKVIASFPWEGRRVNDCAAVRVGFDPAGEWVVLLANGKLFARPLGAGKAWRTKQTLGYATDFAFHPDGRVLCAVYEDGQARFLDAHTGKELRAFKWAKKPKPLYSVAFAPDGLTCAVGGENGKVIVWDVDV